MLRVQPYPGFEQQSKMQNSEASEDLHGLRGGKRYVLCNAYHRSFRSLLPRSADDVVPCPSSVNSRVEKARIPLLLSSWQTSLMTIGLFLWLICCLFNTTFRPFFTYWITTVQIIICLFSIFYYGIGTDFSTGFDVIERSGDVFSSTLSMLHIVVWEQNNVWIGPSFASLVHMGGKYTVGVDRLLRRGSTSLLNDSVAALYENGYQNLSPNQRRKNDRSVRHRVLHRWHNKHLKDIITTIPGPDEKCFQTSRYFRVFCLIALLFQLSAPVRNILQVDKVQRKEAANCVWTGSKVSFLSIQDVLNACALLDTANLQSRMNGR